jgi:Predicted dehydrogenases and related proteins
VTGTNPLRVAVVGAGAFGRNHLRVYRELQDAGHDLQLVAVVDQDSAVAAKTAAEFDIAGFGSVESCLNTVDRLDAASVCVPTVHHAVAAEPLLAAGVELLIEKPLAANLVDARPDS